MDLQQILDMHKDQEDLAEFRYNQAVEEWEFKKKKALGKGHTYDMYGEIKASEEWVKINRYEKPHRVDFK